MLALYAYAEGLQSCSLAAESFRDEGASDFETVLSGELSGSEGSRGGVGSS